MTTNIEVTKKENRRSRWQKLTASFMAMDQAMSYDPQEHRDAIVKHLWEKVAQLETRVNELEGRNQRVA